MSTFWKEAGVAYQSFPNTAHNNRAITLPEHEQLAAPLGLSGLVNYGTGTLPVFADSTGRQVKLRSGVAASIKGTRFNNVSETVLGLTANSSGNPRRDLVVLRLDRANYVITPVVIAGVPAVNPVAPSPVRNDIGGNPNVFDIPLAEVAVPNNASTITSTQVTNRAYWISGTGYVGNSAARPPVEAGVLFFEANTGITWIGSAGGTYLRVASNTGIINANPAGGWTANLFWFARDNNTVMFSMGLKRSGEDVSAGVNSKVAELGEAFWPAAAWYSVYHVTAPVHTSLMSISPAGAVTLNGNTINTIPTNAICVASGSYLAAN